MDFNLVVGKGYSKSELESIFDTNFGARIKGITLRRDRESRPYTIIFSRTHGPYSDRWVGKEFYYDGEGEGKDQTLTTANKALVEANTNGRIIYGFSQEEPSGLWQYLGVLDLIEYSYIPKNGFKTYEFRFRVVPVEPKALDAAKDEIQRNSQLEPELTQAGRKESAATRRARDAAFSRDIRRLYMNRCAICKKERYSTAGYPEVVGAHIFPVEKEGSDDLRNGLALCSLHHWAFDAGILAITDDLTIAIKSGLLSNANYDEISEFKGKSIELPLDLAYKPHPIFLAAHRQLHGF